MEMIKQARVELARYLARFSGEAPDLGQLQLQLLEDKFDVGHRSNMRGHVTTSALVVDLERQKVLLIHHNVYNRWLQPGGHYEDPQVGAISLSPELADIAELARTGEMSCLWHSAFREVVEETGLLSAALYPLSADGAVPLDIDTHAIPANPKKNNEGAHLHHDFIYLASGDSSRPLVAQLDEVSGAKWVPLPFLAEMGHGRMTRIHKKLMDLDLVL